jgi:hypothetical protein
LQEIVTIAHKRPSLEVLELKMPTLKQFYRIARSLPSNDRVPYAFEKRIMAQFGSRPADLWTIWSGTSSILWRAAFSCLAITMLVGAVVTFSDSSRAELFASDLERTVLAPVDVEDSW